MPIESTLGPDRRAHALQHSVLGESCRAVHGRFRALVGSVWDRAWDPNGPARPRAISQVSLKADPLPEVSLPEVRLARRGGGPGGGVGNQSSDVHEPDIFKVVWKRLRARQGGKDQRV